MNKLTLCLFVAALAATACGRSAPDDSAQGDLTTTSVGSTTSTAVVTTQPTTTVERYTGSEATYIVASGDAFSLIAAKFNVTAQKLAEFNDIADPDRIKVGQTIYLPPGAEPVVVTTAPATSEPAASEDTSTTFATATTAGS